MTAGALPDPQIVADEWRVALAAEVLPRNESMLFVHPGINPGFDLDHGRLKRVPAHVPSDQTGAVRQSIGKSRSLGKQQQVRTPAVSGRQYEYRRAILNRIVRLRSVHRLRSH